MTNALRIKETSGGLLVAHRGQEINRQGYGMCPPHHAEHPTSMPSMQHSGKAAAEYFGGDEANA